MAGKVSSKFVTVTRNDIQGGGAPYVFREQQANLFNPSKFEGKLEYPAIVVHYFESEAPDGAFEYVKQKFGKYFFDYSENTERKYCVCYVEGEDGDSGPSSVIEEPYELRDKDPNKYVKVLTQLPKFKLAKNIADQIPYPGSRVTVRYYDTTLDSNPNIDGVVGEIISIEVLNGTPPEPLGTGGGSGRNSFADRPEYSMPVLPVSQEKIDSDAERFNDPDLQFPPLPLMSEDQHRRIKSLNPDFQKIMKSFILTCWEEKGIQINPSDGWRSVRTQEWAFNNWNTNPKKKYPGPADPSKSLSFHCGGLALDFHPVLDFGAGKTLGASLDYTTKEEWLNSGIKDVIDQYNLQWGFYFVPNYDPIHLDMSKILGWNGDDVQKFVETAEYYDLTTKEWPVYKYIIDPTRPPAELVSSDPDGIDPFPPTSPAYNLPTTSYVPPEESEVSKPTDPE